MITETILTDAQIFDCFDTHNGTMCIDYDADELYPVGRAIEQAVLQSPEIQSLREDADRYRVLRDDDYQMLENDPCVSDDYFNTFFGEELDKTIDELKSRRDAAAE